MIFPDQLEKEINQNIPDELRQEIKGHNKILNGIIKKNAPFYKNLLNCILAILLLPFILIYLAFQLILESYRHIRQLFKRFIINSGRLVQKIFKCAFKLHNKIFDGIIYLSILYARFVKRNQILLVKILLKVQTILYLTFKIILYLTIKFCIKFLKPFKEFSNILDFILDYYLYYQSILSLFIYDKYLYIKYHLVKLYKIMNDKYREKLKQRIKLFYAYISVLSPPLGLFIQRVYQKLVFKQFWARYKQFMFKFYLRVVFLTQNKIKFFGRLIKDKVIRSFSKLVNVSTKVILLNLFISLYLIKKIFLYPYIQLDKTLDEGLDLYLIKVNIMENWFQQYFNNILNAQQQRYLYALNCLIQIKNYLISKKRAVINYIKGKLKSIRLQFIQFLKNTQKLIIRLLFNLILISIYPIYLLFQIQLFNQSVIDIILDRVLKNREKFVLLIDKSILKISYILYFFTREKFMIIQSFLRKRQGQFKKKIFKLLLITYNFLKSIITHFIFLLKDIYRNYMDQIIRDVFGVTKQIGFRLAIQLKQLVSQINQILNSQGRKLYVKCLQIKQQVTTILLVIKNQIIQYANILKPLIKQVILEIRHSITHIIKNIQNMVKR